MTNITELDTYEGRYADKFSRVDDAIPATGPITIKLRWTTPDESVGGCVVCLGDAQPVGGAVLAEGPGGIHICDQCLARAAEIDSLLQQHAERWERAAKIVRMLIGRLKVPSVAAFDAEERDFQSYLCNHPSGVVNTDRRPPADADEEMPF